MLIQLTVVLHSHETACLFVLFDPAFHDDRYIRIASDTITVEYQEHSHVVSCLTLLLHVRSIKGPFINYVTLFSTLFTPSLPSCHKVSHEVAPPHNYVTSVQLPPPHPKKLGFLITTIRLFTVIM